MSCAEHLSELAEAALGVELSARAQAHLAACAACRGELDRLRSLAVAMDDGIAAIANADPAPGFAARVRVRLAEQPSPAVVWGRAWIPALVGGLAVLALVAWLAMNRPQPPRVADHPPAALAPENTPGSGVESSRSTERVEKVPPRKPVPVRKGPANEPPLPEVLISDDQWAQVVMLYKLLEREQIGADVLAPPDAKPLDEKFQPLVIARLDPIPPLGDKPNRLR
jgi:hypothetical protein